MKIRVSLYTILFASLLGSCDNFLDIPSETSLSSEVYYKSQSDFEQGINGAYALLRDLYSGSNGAWAMGELRSDNTTYVYNPTDRGTISAEFVKDFLDDANNSVPYHKYVTNYSIISNVNYLLEPIDGVDFDESVKNNIKGQAYFLRALAYFDLVQYFGSVPLHLTPVKTMEETALPLSEVDAVYEQIIKDAKLAIELLPDKSKQELGRATSGAARTLLGNVYIVRKNWSEAEKVLKEVTGYDLWNRSDLNLCISIKMLSNSVQIELFIILWVTKLIHNKQPMYAVLDKDTIKNEILPHLSVAKRGFQSKSSLIEVINAILYKLKTGCQWEYLPVKELFSGKVLKYGAVFHHYNKWSKKGEWKSLWLQLLDKHRSELDMSSVDLDGSHTPAIRGGEEVGYQGRKKRKTTNALYLTDRKGLPLAMSVPKSGEHHDTHNIVAVMQNMMEDMAKANIRTDGLFLNADAGFDCAALRSVLKSYGIVSNICINKRNGTTNDSIVLDELLYRERYSIERTNAWMDSFRTILNRFDTTLRNWESWNYIAFSVMLLRKCARKRKV